MTEALNRLYEELLKLDLCLVVLSQTKPENLRAPLINVPYSLCDYGRNEKNFSDTSGCIDEEGEEIIARDMFLHNGPNSDELLYRKGYCRAKKIFSEFVAILQPAYGIVWGSTFPSSLLQRKVLKNANVPVVIIERGLLPQTLMLEEQGHGTESILMGNESGWKEWNVHYDEARYFRAQKYYMEHRPAKYKQGEFIHDHILRQKYNITTKHILLYLGQHDGWSGLLPRNTEISHNLSPWFASTEEALSSLLKSLETFSDVTLLFKPHPHDPVQYDHLHHPQLRIARNENLHSLCTAADVVVALSTTAQFEALLYEKPIVLLGRSQLSGKGIAYEYNGEIQLSVLLEEAFRRINFQERIRAGRVFIDGILHNFLFGTTHAVPTQKQIKELAETIAFHALEEPKIPLSRNVLGVLADKVCYNDIHVHERNVENDYETLKVLPRLIAFYLPQFHPIPENDAWWGKGFTEWTNVTKAKPLFEGHYQPHLPADMAFYDLRVPEVRKAQAELARQYGIEGFCYWHYWFNGKLLLERPVEEILKSSEPDFPFCLAWANEHWSRRWDGMEYEVLQEQNYGGTDDDKTHFYYLLKAFNDRRYIRVDQKPVFLIYNPAHLPDVQATLRYWRTLAQQEGLEGLYCIAVKSHTESQGKNWLDYGFDAELIFQPNWGEVKRYLTLKNQRAILSEFYTTENVGAYVAEYRELWKYLATSVEPHEKQISSVVPLWDNSARRRYQPVILHNPDPKEYQRWLAFEIDRARTKRKEERFLFLNAWNEWAEGNHLEPDQRFGRGFLEATRAALKTDKQEIADVYCDLALTLLERGNQESASEYLMRAQQLSSPEHVKKLMERKLPQVNILTKNAQAVAEYRRGNVDAACTILENLLQEHSADELTSENLARVYFEKQLYTKAWETLKPFISQRELPLSTKLFALDCAEAAGLKEDALRLALLFIEKEAANFLLQRRLQSLLSLPTTSEQQLSIREQESLPLTSIIIVTHNNLSFTEQCLQSIEEHTPEPHELIVVDNGSTDGTPLWLQKYAQHRAQCRLLLNDTNQGFPAAVNQGLKIAQGENIVLLNNDTIVTRVWLSGLLRAVKSDSAIGLVGPMTNIISGVQQDATAWYVSLEQMKRHAAMTTKLYSGVLYPTDRLRFFCVLLTKRVLETLGGLDEQFRPGNYEDDDYCLRAQLGGFKIVIARDVFIHHFGSQSFSVKGTRWFEEVLRVNREKFIKKWNIKPEEIGRKTPRLKQQSIFYPVLSDEFREAVERALFCIHENNFTEAYLWLEKAIQLAEQKSEWDSAVIEKEDLYDLAGKVCLSLENLEKAKEYFERELQVNPHSSRACTSLGNIFSLAGLYDASKTMYEWAVVNDESNERAKKGLAAVNHILGLEAEHNSLLLQSELQDRKKNG